MNTEEKLKWIENATCEELLRKARFEPLGSGWFEGNVGKRHMDRLNDFRRADPAEYTAASKRIGWIKR